MRIGNSRQTLLRLMQGFAVILSMHVFSNTSFGILKLQLYIEGATYQADTESWVWESSEPGEMVRLWAIGNISAPGGKGTIHDIRLSIVYDSDAVFSSIVLTPTKAGGTGMYNGVTDPSVAPIATAIGAPHDDGSVPLLGDGSPLPPHGEYGEGRTWQEFDLGDFDEPDSLIGDFIYSFPTELHAGGQIHAYEVEVIGATEPFQLHFDLYNHIEAKNGARVTFAAFSHDGTIHPPIAQVPEASSILAWLLGGVACCVVRFARRRAEPCV
ncbi:MAG: choice-of-anchor N protein [Pirellulales bacterium]